MTSTHLPARPLIATPAAVSLVVTETESTTSWAGKAVALFGSPGQSPPTARLRIRKNGLLKAQVLPPTSAGVRVS